MKSLRWSEVSLSFDMSIAEKSDTNERLSGVWFDVSLMGKVFKKIADALPFIHAVELERAALAGDISAAVHELPIVLGYAVILSAVGIAVFTKKMKEN